ncbi:MAG: 6-carboxytetrahydropterin synthase QueD [Selenomonadaceae bacterium]|nr:6-carboxytetrahydropterin synthase QueD [Selenomonadaceae bacterium]MBR1859891.1 6-carboxytetrahydropterin synthase QueD [Selenomonadaceae bacterium]
MFELTVKSEFEAAHQINGYKGKCQRLHGHNWSVEAVVIGDKLDELGMLVDFKMLKQELNKVLDELDHRYLNELAMFKTKNPTAENLAQYVFDKLSESEIFSNSKLKAIKVYESPKSCVTYTNQ